MAIASAVHVSHGKKLEVLRRLDQFRHWRSLDEKRYCLVCGKIITGHQIRITGGTRGNSPLRLNCLTERCNSIPMDWVLPPDEVLAKAAMTSAEDPPHAIAQKSHERVAQGKQAAFGLHKFAMFFKRPF